MDQGRPAAHSRKWAGAKPATHSRKWANEILRRIHENGLGPILQPIRENGQGYIRLSGVGARPYPAIHENGLGRRTCIMAGPLPRPPRARNTLTSTIVGFAQDCVFIDILSVAILGS